MKAILPTELLPENTLVQVRTKRGKVIKAEWVKDQFNQPICLHTISFDQKSVYKYRAGRRVITWEAIKPKIEQVNYSFIYPLADNK